MKTLHLNLKKHWFEMILAGEKLEEYREVKEFWALRLLDFKEPAGMMFPSMPKYLRGAFNYSVGYTGTRLKAVNYLLSTVSNFKAFDTTLFKNGYQKNARTMLVEFKGIDIGPAKPEWSDNWQGDVFRIKLGKIIEYDVR